MFKSKISRRYSLWLVAIFSVMGISYLALSLALSSHYLKQVQIKINADVAQTLIQDNELVKQGKLNEPAIEDTFHRYMLLNPNLEIYLVDLSGNLLKYSANADRIKRNHIDTKPLQRFLNHPSQGLILGDDPRTLDGKSPFSVAYLPNDKHPEAYLYVVIQPHIAEEVDRRLQESILLKLSGWSFLTSLLLGLGLGSALFYFLNRRIALLSEKVKRFEQAPQQVIPPPLHLKDELDELALATADMSVQLRDQLEHIQQSDQQRRFMISSLSHDLRTPLTNLLGYMEQAKVDNSMDYLDTAFQNGLKLKNYLDRLFEYAKLDSNLIQLNAQHQSLSEFCETLLEQYQALSPNADWWIDIHAGIEMAFDRELMESAIRNLLDNAMKYGEGWVSFALYRFDDNITIRVCSAGDELHQVNRLLESKLAVANAANGSTQNHTGFGLAIVRFIVEKHEGTLAYGYESNKNCFEIRLSNAS
ncbi:sensor histidine kinase KdpD [Hydrogenovibrio sp. JE_KL2]|uniref:sensor histidine kinase n=1 Tax=Hydrogenovibrio sp. JE_KL2 TaxID=2651188 RepID=UPI00128B84B0|nr:HAMP domain-containing sensor histidine kinase [Hydrogenovibrio sp. JE_KL2]MPQ76548.1 HAMP domain-containing histidine kinase [Hydrogenovibrio sp. JE_KL2]